ncbi:acyltransferase [Methanococcoides sp. SA1]|nr:acyltransferase [Methanococcoides sp. SA1]
MNSDEKYSSFEKTFMKMIDNQSNPFHPLVFVKGNLKVGKNVYVGLFSEINAQGSEVIIENNCDIASFVSINVADSHKMCIGLADKNEKKPIHIEKNVFIGSHSFVKGGAYISHHTVVAAGTIVESTTIPPYSLVYGNPMVVKEGYYKR